MYHIKKKVQQTPNVEGARYRSSHFEQKMAILDTIRALIAKYKTTYCYPSQKTICSLVLQWHGIMMSRRTLNRRLDEMVKEKCLHRICRHRRGKNGALELWTTAYYILQRVVAPVKKFFQVARRVAEAYRVPEKAQYILTTERDLSKSFGNEVEKVPLEWIKDFRLQLQSA